MKKVFAAFASVVLFALVCFTGVAANAATVERTISPSGHVIDSFYMMCRVVDVQNDGIKYIITVEDNSGNKWEFFDSEDYWKKGDKMTCVFDYCETCETLELNGVVETDIKK